MAKCAESALLAAFEVYNKPLIENREQTLALLLVNAWDPQCAHKRKLDPRKTQGTWKWFYNLDATLVRLDREYSS